MASLLAGIPQAQAPNLGASFMEGRQAVRTDQNQGLQLQQNRNATARDTNSLIAQYAVNADTPEKWQQAMSDLQRAGVPDATQFADKFNLRDTIIQRAYSAADQMNSRTAGQFLGSLPQGTGTLSSLPMLGADGATAPVASPGATLSPSYLASLGTVPPQGAAPPVGSGIPSRPDAPIGAPDTRPLAQAPATGAQPAPPVAYTPNRATLSDNIQALRPAFAQAGLNAALGYGADGMRGSVGGDVIGDGRLPADMIGKESGGRQFAANGQPLTSSAGAVGVAQVEPATGPEAARLAGLPWAPVRFRTDARYNEALGAAYYDAQQQKFQDPELARAAYNAGPTRTDQYVTGGRPLPAETVRYADLNGDGRVGGGAAVRPATRDIQPAAPNGVPVSSLQILAQNPTYAGTAISTALNHYGAPKDSTVWAKLDDGRLFNQRTGEIVTAPGGTAGTVDLTPEQARALGFPPGSVVQRKADGTLSVAQKGEETSGGPYQGNALDAQDSNILLRGDPASPEYALAYQRQFLTPKVVPIPDPNQPGQMMLGSTLVQPPAGIRPPSGMQAPQQSPPAQSTPAPQTPSPQTMGQQPPASVAPGSVSVQPLPGTSKPLVPTEQQRLDASFAARMVASNGILDSTEQQGASFGQRAAAGIPGVGNYLVSPEYQQFDQARRDFVNAQLRRESGAAISQGEFDNAEKQYFPQPGDSPQAIEQKRTARQRAVENMARQAGPAINPGNTGAAPTTAPQQSSAPPAIRNDDDYNALPSGQEFIAPDGTHRRKP